MEKFSMDIDGQDDAEETSPVEEVALTVPTADDPTLPALTFRVWVLGIICCAGLAFVNQFFSYRDFPLSISTVTAQVAVVPIGRFMARLLPTTKWRLPFTPWRVSLNPGPFNTKEHVLITIFSTAGASGVYAVHILTIMKAFYKRPVSPLASYLLIVTTQTLGYGWAGVFRKLLVESPFMWWPANLVQVSLFRTLNEREKRVRGGMTRLQFFLIVLICSFAYYIVPNYLFGMISTVSVLCLIWKKSVTVQQVGSGASGLGVGSFGLDWATVASYLGSPLATPWHAIANVMVGFFVVVYIITPCFYYLDVFNAKKFPIISSGVFDEYGNKYNTTRVLTSKLTFNSPGYESYSKIHLSAFFAFTYGVGFAALTATLSHVIIFHGKDIYRQTKAAFGEYLDVHGKMMRKNYKPVPQWWFLVVLAVTIGLAFWACEGFGNQLQLPYWGIIMACTLSFFFTLPVGIIQATTNQQPGLNIITEYIIGYLYQGHPLANVCFKTYGYISMSQALSFLQDFKLGQYMKIPPRSMFVVQLTSTLVASTVYFGTSWWMLTTVKNICDKSIKGNLWTCPGDSVFYSASIIWGVVGPKRMFGPLGLYAKINWFFLAGAVAPVIVWGLQKQFPKRKWLKYVNTPILIGATGNMPPASSVNFITWGLVGFVFNYIIFRKYKAWWTRYNYVLSGALDAGVVFLGVLCYFALQSYGIQNLDWWGGAPADDKCNLASCPTAPGVYKDGCPAY